MEARIIEALADILARGQNDTWLIAGNGGEPLGERLPLLLSHAGAQRNQWLDVTGKTTFKAIEVLIALRQDERRTAFTHRPGGRL
jgi:hypothetical protein